MQVYIETLYHVSNPSILCVQRDTDYNGYVSCTATYNDKQNVLQTVTAECAVTLNNDGCRPLEPEYRD